MVDTPNITAHAAGKSGSGIAQSSREPALIIAFEGLMVFHPDPGGQYLEVGIIPAPEHEFRIELLSKSPEGVSTSTISLEQFLSSNQDTLSLQFPTPTKGITFHKNGPFDRKSVTNDQRDIRWLIDLESSEFYGRKLTVANNQLAVVLRVNGGEFYTKTTTLPLVRRKGDGTFYYFGRAAQEIATDVFLQDGDMVLRSETSGTEILRLKNRPDTTYEMAIKNLPLPHEDMATNSNHFGNYYRVFPMPRSEWYEFRVDGLQKQLASQFSRVAFTSPNTYEAPCMGAGYGGAGGP